MIGITLTSERVRSAPPEVRHWLEQTVPASFGWHLPAVRPNHPKPAACSVEEASEILSLIREMIPVVNVFFQLGHKGSGHSIGGLEAFRLVDIQRHVRLQQVQACLQIINDALRRVRGGTEATFSQLDDRGFCFIAEQTQHSIATLWKEMAAADGLEHASPTPSYPAAPSEPFGPSSPLRGAKAHAAGINVSGELATEAAVAKIAT